MCCPQERGCDGPEAHDHVGAGGWGCVLVPHVINDEYGFIMCRVEGNLNKDAMVKLTGDVFR